MSAYAPHEAIAVWITAGLLILAPVSGYAIQRAKPGRLARMAAWIVVIAAVVGVERANAHEPPGVRMLAIIGGLLFAMKAVVAVEARWQGSPPLPFPCWLAFAALWPGMRPGPFAHRSDHALPGPGELVRTALLRIAAGFGLILFARMTWLTTHSLSLATVPLLIGISFVLHFGVFDLLAGAWRLAGVDCKPLFRSPLRSTSLAEFWGRRWNLAFSEMTALAVYQPLVRRAGRRIAIFASFLMSGLLHELAISVPVRAGYGLPLSYFAVQGALMTIEGRLAVAKRPIDGVPWIGRAWTLFWLLAPLPILFHRPFLVGCVWPLAGIGK
jgi:alginate O-acetyltransferase complex protein AlgI